jgi:ABC-type uncharacterized transport system permease subunit
MSVLNQLIASGLTLGTPIVLAALGGMFSYNARVFNIALEAFMLVGAYFSVTMTQTLGSVCWASWRAYWQQASWPRSWASPCSAGARMR